MFIVSAFIHFIALHRHKIVSVLHLLKVFLLWVYLQYCIHCMLFTAVQQYNSSAYMFDTFLAVFQPKSFLSSKAHPKCMLHKHGSGIQWSPRFTHVGCSLHDSSFKSRAHYLHVKIRHACLPVQSPR